jgi:diacylglycerol kinase family enzyme
MLQTALSAPSKDVLVTVDGQSLKALKVVNFCVANARYFGGGMKIAPEASLDDGLLDIVAIGDLNALQILANSPQLYRGTHLSIEQVRHERARTVTARASDAKEDILIEVDGELPGRLPATFEIIPAALRIRCG